MAGRPDAFDIAPLEKSLNDSAVRVSTIWVSFLLFSLYLAVAAGAVTHRQLLLQEPVKLPALNIDLPLWGFFFLTPVLFTILHAYVLLQVLLLARTAAAYNEAANRASMTADEDAALRQRLANTLFAQIFAGSPREREGWLGFVLRMMAWISLAIAPILILLLVQFMFLPYHSHFVTWTHRLLIFAELVVAFVAWPLILDAEQDLNWTGIRKWFTLTFHSVKTLGSKHQRKDLFRFFRRGVLPVAVALTLAFASLSFATFPGEPHINLASGTPWASVRCDRPFFEKFDRLNLPHVDVVDDDKLAKIIHTTKEKELSPFKGERTQDFRDRNLQCAVFERADLRYTDFTGANLSGANLDEAELQGATLDNARLDEASLARAKMEEASLEDASLRDARLSGSDLQGAWLVGAQFQGADLSYASLIRAWGHRDTSFQAADLSNARLQGSQFSDVQLQAANLTHAIFHGAILSKARLQGSTLTNADLGGADLSGAQLQGAVLKDSDLTATNLEKAILWHTSGANCHDAQVKDPRLDPILEFEEGGRITEVTSASVTEFIHKIVAAIPERRRKDTTDLLNDRLSQQSLAADLDNERIWRNCSENHLSPDDYYKKLALYIVGLACSRAWNEYFGVDSIIDTSVTRELDGAPRAFTDSLARGLLGLDQTACRTPIRLNDQRRDDLQRMLARPQEIK